MDDEAQLGQRVYKTAHIAFKNHRATINCVVRRLSHGGACLEVESPIGIPESFDLIFDSDKVVRPCLVTWRAEKRVGVEFGS
jgi:PilZ domain